MVLLPIKSTLTFNVKGHLIKFWIFCCLKPMTVRWDLSSVEFAFSDMLISFKDVLGGNAPEHP